MNYIIVFLIAVFIYHFGYNISDGSFFSGAVTGIMQGLVGVAILEILRVYRQQKRISEDSIIREGKMNKGGRNPRPSTPRPARSPAGVDPKKE